MLVRAALLALDVALCGYKNMARMESIGLVLWRSFRRQASARVSLWAVFALLLAYPAAAAVAAVPAGADPLARGFAQPPEAARPWVYWFWLSGNLSSNGITADLEAMKRTGIGGVLIMEVDQGAPKGPADFGGPLWRELFKHVCAEAERLGLEVNMNNDAGWCGSGGPWITPELSMQKITVAELAVEGPRRLAEVLPQPAMVANYYRDIAVFALPTPAGDEVHMREFSPKVTASGLKAEEAGKWLSDKPKAAITLALPKTGQPAWVLVEFPQPFRARELRVSVAGSARLGLHLALQSSEDGSKFTTLRALDVKAGAVEFTFPETSARFYRLHCPRADAKLEKLTLSGLELSPRYRIEGISGKAAFTKQEIPLQSTWPALPETAVVASERVQNLTAQLDKDGKLTWDVPAGKWTILRVGHTSTGKDNHPAPLPGRGLECDKLSKEAAEAMFNGLMGNLISDSRPRVPKTLISTHIDSWEVGSQNWTPRFREEFQRLRGYDPLPYLPVFTGRVLDSLEVSERFLWDVRQTVSDLLVDNYAGHFRELAHKYGMRLSIEAYDGVPCDDLTYAGRADEPMGEFWSWGRFGAAYSSTEMASAAHVYGRPIVGAEAFTATDQEKWQGHPANVKDIGDWAFCEGINRFVFHRYALQPWPDRRPGMSMGPWGLHYERSQTWWEQSRAWHEYLARCQFLLQQGLFVADICYLAPERSPQRWAPPVNAKATGYTRPGYNFDGCPPEVVLTRMKVSDGQLVLPDGMSYRLLVLPAVETMTPKLLRKIRELVEAGATVLGPRPVKSPSLANYPQCDAEVQQLAAELWGDCDGKNVTKRKHGKGYIACGVTPDEVLNWMGQQPDFTAKSRLRYIHRVIGDADVYFVANPFPRALDEVCKFHISGKRPELWWPDTGRMEPAALYEAEDCCTRVRLSFDPSGSVFVVFRPGTVPAGITAVKRDGKTILDIAPAGTAATAAGGNNAGITNSFTMAAWVKPAMNTLLPKEAAAGVVNLNAARNDVLYPPPGHEVYPEPGHSGCGFAVGQNGVAIYEHGDSYFAPLLVHAAPLTDWTHVAIVYRDRVPSLYLNGKLARQGLKSAWLVHPGVGVPHDRPLASFNGELGELKQVDRALDAAEVNQLMQTMKRQTESNVLPAVNVTRAPDGQLWLETAHSGAYEIARAGGKTATVQVPDLPPVQTVEGPWEVRFAPGWGAPERITLPQLISWSDHAETGVKYFSGAATYRTTFQRPAATTSALRLDLGRVEVMAEVKLNGQDLGILWKPPYRVDLPAAAVKPGENVLEIKVVNLWINRQIGDEQLPEDSQRNANGTLKEWPQWLQEDKPNPSGRFTFTSWRLWKKSDPLVPSGLLGPVTLQPLARVPVN